MNYEYITEDKHINKIIPDLQKEKFLYLDTEVAVKNIKSINFFSDKVRLIQIGTSDNIFIIDVFKVGQESIKKLKPVLQSKGVVGHNLKFDIKFLKTNFDIFPQIVFDTMIASQIISEGRGIKHSLFEVSKREAKLNIDKSFQTSSWYIENLTKEQIEYSAMDIQVLKEIFPVLKEKLNSQKTPNKSVGETKEIFGVENPIAAIEFRFVPYLALVELVGMPIDTLELEILYKQVSSAYQRKYINFLREYGIDPFSPQKVINWITNKLKINLPKNQKGHFSSQDKVLKKYIDKKEIKELIDIRTTKKLLDKLKELKEHSLKSDNSNIGRIYTEFRQIGSPTGRMSSSKPNLQNITKDLRKLFKPSEEYVMIVADYSQIELRLAAQYTKDETMIKAFKEGKDLHKFTASLITGKPYDEITKEERQMAKAINFGLIYGISPKSLMEYASSVYGVHISLNDAKTFHSKFFHYYKQFKGWHENTKQKLNKQKQIVVQSLLGRRMIASKFTDAVNYPIQASGSDLLKLAVNFFYKFKQDIDANIVNLVHDEIIIEVKQEYSELIKNILEKSLEKAGKIILRQVPVEFEINIVKSWAEK